MTVLVACSGGPDSVALVHSLHCMQVEFPFSFRIAHVNHRLRGRASDADEAFVRGLARRLSWPCDVVRRPVDPHAGNVEERAREARYEALLQLAGIKDCALVLTAHTADDQAETVLLNLLRGTGPKGLSGIPLFRRVGEVVIGRPFLSVPRSNVERYLKAARQNYRKDASNRKTKFLRNWLRHEILPAFERRAPGFKKRLLQLANLFREEELEWEQKLRPLVRRRIRSYRGGRLLDFEGALRYSPAVQRRLLRAFLGEKNLSFERLEALRCWMGSPPSDGRVWMMKRGWVVERLSRSKGFPSASLFWLKQARRSEKE